MRPACEARNAAAFSCPSARKARARSRITCAAARVPKFAASVPGRSENEKTCRYVNGRRSMNSSGRVEVGVASRPGSPRSRPRRSPHRAAGGESAARARHSARRDTSGAWRAGCGPSPIAAARENAARGAGGSNQRDEILGDVLRLDRAEAEPSRSVSSRMRRTTSAERGARREIAAIAAEIDSAQHDFAARLRHRRALRRSTHPEAGCGCARARTESRSRSSDCCSRPEFSGWGACGRRRHQRRAGSDVARRFARKCRR